MSDCTTWLQCLLAEVLLMRWLACEHDHICSRVPHEALTVATHTVHLTSTHPPTTYLRLSVIYLPACLSLPTSPSIHPSSYQSNHYIHPSTYPSHPSASYLHTCLSLFPSARLSVCVCVCLPACLPTLCKNIFDSTAPLKILLWLHETKYGVHSLNQLNQTTHMWNMWRQEQYVFISCFTVLSVLHRAPSALNYVSFPIIRLPKSRRVSTLPRCYDLPSVHKSYTARTTSRTYSMRRKWLLLMQDLRFSRLWFQSWCSGSHIIIRNRNPEDHDPTLLELKEKGRERRCCQNRNTHLFWKFPLCYFVHLIDLDSLHFVKNSPYRTILQCVRELCCISCANFLYNQHFCAQKYTELLLMLPFLLPLYLRRSF